MGTKLLARLARAFEHVRDGRVLRSWTPAILDPYGVLPTMDALEDEAERRARETVLAFEPRVVPRVEQHRTSA